MGLNSITALKLSAIVSRILNKKETFISGRFLVQSALLGWFGGLASLKHYANKAMRHYGNKA